MYEQTIVSGNRSGVGGKYQRHLFTAVRQLSQPEQRPAWIHEAFDAIVMRVPLA
jgi:hypothetical protein